MITRSEFYLPVDSNGDHLFLQKWSLAQPSSNPLGIFIITHGVAEHSECHHFLAENLAKQNYLVYAWDLPGHGKSYGKRGYISEFSEYTRCLDKVIGDILNHNPNQPKNVFLFGHSLGGLITLFYLLQNPNSKITAACLSSPALGVALEVPKIKDQAARILNRWAPRMTISHQIIYEDLTHDSELIASYYKDPLRHKRFSAPLYLGTLDAMQNVLIEAEKIHQPLFIQAAGTDRVTDVHATERFFERLGSKNKKLKIYKDSYHEIFNDFEKNLALTDLLQYLKQF